MSAPRRRIAHPPFGLPTVHLACRHELPALRCDDARCSDNVCSALLFMTISWLERASGHSVSGECSDTQPGGDDAGEIDVSKLSLTVNPSSTATAGSRLEHHEARIDDVVGGDGRAVFALGTVSSRGVKRHHDIPPATAPPSGRHDHLSDLREAAVAKLAPHRHPSRADTGRNDHPHENRRHGPNGRHRTPTRVAATEPIATPMKMPKTSRDRCSDRAIFYSVGTCAEAPRHRHKKLIADRQNAADVRCADHGSSADDGQSS